MRFWLVRYGCPFYMPVIISGENPPVRTNKIVQLQGESNLVTGKLEYWTPDSSGKEIQIDGPLVEFLLNGKKLDFNDEPIEILMLSSSEIKVPEDQQGKEHFINGILYAYGKGND